MGVEIERKFIVTSDGWRSAAGPGRRLSQGYICAASGRTVRVRISEPAAGGGNDASGANDRPVAMLTLKGPVRSGGLERDEFEYRVPVEDARVMLATMCGSGAGGVVGGVIRKVRREVDIDGVRWEVDQFEDANAPLVLAEVECQSVEAARGVRLPAWVGREVTQERRYSNAALSERPFGAWDAHERV